MIGIHINVKHLQDIKEALKYANEIGCTHVQMFNENIDSKMKIKTLLKKYDLKLIIHASYVINIATDFDPLGWRTKYLLMEIDRSIRNGADGMVVHLGNSAGKSQEKAIDNMYFLLSEISKKIKKKSFYLLLETTSGQGTELCYKLEDLAKFYNRLKEDKKNQQIKLCLDTCHIFCAGYDLRTKKSVDNYIKKFDSLIGTENVKLLHVNDSLNDMGTRKDRHADLGEGYIGAEGIKHFYKYFASKNIPAILETSPEKYDSEVNFLKTE